MKNTKKISLIISTYDDIKNPHYGGGGAIAVHQLAMRLNHKYMVRVISWNYSGKRIEQIDGVVYQRFGFKFLSPRIAMFAYQLLLPLLAATRNYDVWLESFCPPFTTAVLPLFTKKPVVGIVHMLAAEDMERKYKLPFHLIENVGIKKYKNIIATSEAMKEKIEIMHPTGLVTLISNGISQIYEHELPRKKTVLFLGRIEVNQKGIDLLIPAFKRFNESKNNTFQLVIAGDGNINEMDKLKKLISKYGITNSVVFVGKVFGEKKDKILRTAACIVVASRFETYSLVALEALACGTPLVCFAIEGLKWIPANVVQRATPFDAESLAKAILHVVNNPKMADTMRAAGKKYAKRFTWDAIAVQYEKYIDSILE